MKRVLLGVSGSVAAYRAGDVARELMRQGCQVRVCLTDGGQKFVTPALFEALTGQPCLIDTFEEPIPGRMAHIDWAREADLLLIAPATANTMSGLARGEGTDMLTTLALAFEGRAMLAPAMNPSMYQHPTTRENLEILRSRGWHIVEPAEGDVACGENGQGKLASIATLVGEAHRLLTLGQGLAGQHVLLTNGPTVERLDDVRFLSNRSSGKMGAALAQAALWMGAKVTVVSGPVQVTYPKAATVIPVESAEEMLAAAERVARPDWIFGVAAVADYRPAEQRPGKIKRSDATLRIELIPNPDIIARLGEVFPDSQRVAFAAEISADEAEGRRKRAAKNVHAVALNAVGQVDSVFGSDTNELHLITEHESASSGRQSKLGCAIWLLVQLTKLPVDAGA